MPKADADADSRLRLELVSPKIRLSMSNVLVSNANFNNDVKHAVSRNVDQHCRRRVSALDRCFSAPTVLTRLAHTS